MPRKTDRDFTGMFAAAGIVDALAGPLVSDTIQMVYTVGDLADLAPIFQPVRGFMTITQGLQAARVSGLSIRPTARAAIVVEWFRNDSAINMIYVVGQLALTNDLTTPTVDFETGGTARAELEIGTRAVNTVGINLPAGENLADRHPNIVLSPGEIFLITGVSVNTAITVSIAWREVPRQAIGS